MNKFFLFVAGLAVGAPLAARGWDYEGHRIVNQLALASLPTNFPAFVREAGAAERVAFLAGEPDRWRNVSDTPLRHFNGPDHYIDLEDLEPLKLAPAALSHLRYEFVSQLAVARAAHPENFPPIDAVKDTDKVRAYPGFLPWTINEHWLKLKSAFSSLKVFEEMGTPEEIANEKANVIYIMGVMGHYVGDAAQPLHTTKHFNGWVGDNPKHYTTNRTFHAWIDGGFFQKVGGADARRLQAKLRPAQMLWPGDPKAKHEGVFPEVIGYIEAQFKLVEPLYKLEKAKQLTGEGETGRAGQAFLEGQLAKAGQMLGDLWYSAWQQAPPDAFLKSSLTRRKLAKEAGK